ncbi:MAG: hypothetical protein QM703_28790 [Gemmatales bacterium]
MKKPQNQKRSQRHHQQTKQTQSVPRQTDADQKHVEELPTVEWGDRIHSGKSIARGGKEDGFVPGAMPAK